MEEVKDLLIVRLGFNSKEEDNKSQSEFYRNEIKSHVVIVIAGENACIETKFEIVHLK